MAFEFNETATCLRVLDLQVTIARPDFPDALAADTLNGTSVNRPRSVHDFAAMPTIEWLQFANVDTS